MKPPSDHESAPAAGEPQSAEDLRAALAERSGRELWQSLEEVAQSSGFRALVEAQFPSQVARLAEGPERRDFLKLMASSLALGGLGACTRQPAERILPYAAAPEARVPGRPQFFATAAALGGAGIGLVVESHEGRPTRVDGNPDHPSSLGGCDPLAQAALLGLYDPDRSEVVRTLGRIGTWDKFFEALEARVALARARGGAGLAILSRTIASPTLARQRAELIERLPELRWVQYEPIGRDSARAGAELAFGRDVGMRYDFARAERVVALDADVLCRGAGHLRYARDWARGRRARASATGATGTTGANRLYAIETTPTNTGASADERLALGPAALAAFAEALARELGVAGAHDVAAPAQSGPWLRALAADLRAHHGASLVVAGESLPAHVHALVHALNAALGAPGRTLDYVDPIEPVPSAQLAELSLLAERMRAGEVHTLVVLDGNPIYDAPADLELAAAFERVEWRAHAGLYEDETSAQCHWHVPLTHFLEHWSDVRAHDGTVSIVQPLIAPLYGSRSEHEIVAELGGLIQRTGYDAVRATWRALLGEQGFEVRWERALHDGIVAGTRPSALADVALSAPALERAPRPGAPGAGLELHFAPDASVWDGRFANNGWLQELPRPLSLLTWDNAVLLAPETAERLGVASEDVVRLALGERALEAAVWVHPGQAEEVATLHLGYGRTHGGRLALGAGFDAYRLRTRSSPWSAAGLAIERTGERYELATTQRHHSMEGRDLVRVTTFERFARGERGRAPGQPERAPASAAAAHAPDAQAAHGAHGAHAETSLYPAFPYEGYAWGMVIDLTACIGCRACVISCQSENSVPVVGKREVRRGREMHWIRIDRYYESRAASRTPVAVHHQPVPCMHCENAPCEVVCPVGATVHGSEGLNEMVYNRCVGTRYCSNNCPYKVRRFNFFKYADTESEVQKLGRNPDVTVRSRGVMEKCTYCVQRINEARIRAKREDRKIGANEVVTACQAVCPTEAIAFGDIRDEASAVFAARAEPHHYGLLEELNTKPRTTYLAKLTNPNPDLHAG